MQITVFNGEISLNGEVVAEFLPGVSKARQEDFRQALLELRTQEALEAAMKEAAENAAQEVRDNVETYVYSARQLMDDLAADLEKAHELLRG